MDIHESFMDIHDWNIDLLIDNHIQFVDIPKLYSSIISFMDLYNSIYVSP